MTRRWDSLRMMLRAERLILMWERQDYRGAMRERLDRTYRAARYLYQRALRQQGGSPCQPR